MFRNVHCLSHGFYVIYTQLFFIFWQIFPDSEMRANREWNPDKKETTVWWMGIHALICVYVRFCQRLCLKSTRINFGNACMYRLSTFCKTLFWKKEFLYYLSLFAKANDCSLFPDMLLFVYFGFRQLYCQGIRTEFAL